MELNIKNDKLRISLIILIVVVGLSGLVSIFFVKYKEIESEVEKEFIQTCENLSIPKEFSQTQSDNFQKEGRIVFSSRYNSEMSPILVENHFKELLLSKDWKLEENSWSKGRLGFLKGKTRVKIYFERTIFSSTNYYDVECTYNFSGKGIIDEYFGQ
jgi:hypothetical protein